MRAFLAVPSAVPDGRRLPPRAGGFPAVVLLALALCACGEAAAGRDDTDTSTGEDFVPASGAAQVRISDHEACVLLVSGRIKCFGKVAGLRSILPPKAVRRIENMTGQGVLVVFMDGTIAKLDSFGQELHPVGGVAGVRSAAYHQQNLVTIDRAGAAGSWKADFGMDSTFASPLGSLAQVPALKQVAVELGGRHAIAVTKEGKVWTWSYASGDGPPQSIAEVPGLLDAVQAALDQRRYYVLLADGSVRWWETFRSEAPQIMTGLEAGVVEVRAYHACGCARLASGGVKCWGAETCWGAGGHDPLHTYEVREVAGVTEVAGVDVGGSGSAVCARRMDGSVWCWGSDMDDVARAGAAHGDGRPVRVQGL